VSTDPSSDEALSFSSRIKRRHHEYWRRRWFTLHQNAFCQLGYRTRDDSFEKWHCCPLWQRKLTNKWNSREFALKLGCRVPELFWSGISVDDSPFSQLPVRYVMRGVTGFSGRAVLVLDRGRNLLNGEPYDHARIRDAMRPHVGGYPSRRLLVEEFLPPEPHAASDLPRDYKVFAFGDRIGAIQIIERRPERFVMGFDESWKPMPALRKKRATPLEVVPPRPDCLDEMLSVVRKIGAAYGSFVRVDMYVAASGAVFGELTGTPSEGNGYSDFADKYFGELWAETCPASI
jgi:hypothetical protein